MCQASGHSAKAWVAAPFSARARSRPPALDPPHRAPVTCCANVRSTRRPCA